MWVRAAPEAKSLPCNAPAYVWLVHAMNRTCACHNAVETCIRAFSIASESTGCGRGPRFGRASACIRHAQFYDWPRAHCKRIDRAAPVLAAAEEGRMADLDGRQANKEGAGIYTGRTVLADWLERTRSGQSHCQQNAPRTACASSAASAHHKLAVLDDAVGGSN